MQESELRRAQRALAIEDVYICDANAWADRAYDPTVPLPQPFSLQIKVEPTGEVQVLQSQREEKTCHLVRYFVSTGLRVLKAGTEQNSPELKRENLHGEVTATFVLRYLWRDEVAPTQELLGAFVDNAVHHMWPYWREFLQTATARLRLPPVILPLRVVAQPQIPGSSSEPSDKQ